MITKAAIKSKGEIFTGKKHGDIFAEDPKLSLNPDRILGFTDDNGKFYDREEAYFEALKCGQIKAKDRQKLVSEDLC